jgi:carbon starvation protein
MNTLFAVILGAITVYLAYTRYARRIDRNVIQSDPKRITPATLYMDGVDFMPTNRNILFGYHFKSIAAAGPIVGAIVAATLWGWLPALIWLVLGVVFIGWASDYSAIVLSVRNEGNSLSAVAHRLISPRTRTVLFLFIFFYLLLIAGAFVGIMATVLESQPKTHLGMILLVFMGLLLGQMLYRWRVGLVAASFITVGITLLAILAGPLTEGAFKGLNAALNGVTGGAPLVTYFDPTLANFKGAEAKIMPSLSFGPSLFAFSAMRVRSSPYGAWLSRLFMWDFGLRPWRCSWVCREQPLGLSSSPRWPSSKSRLSRVGIRN